jgi:hypothetical protein
VLWHLAGSDYQLYTAKAAITAAAEQLDPVKWDELRQGVMVERRFVQGWLDDDLAVGSQIAAGNYAGKYVTEVIVPGGKFDAIEGGNRPAFISGGVAGDTIRNIKSLYGLTFGNNTEFGPLIKLGTGGNAVQVGSTWAAQTGSEIDVSRVVPTGPEVQPRHLSVRFWRRLPDVIA